MQQVAGNDYWELNYQEESKTYFLYSLKSDDTLTITNVDNFIEMADMLEAHRDGNLIE